jgi:hypothetical protein
MTSMATTSSTTETVRRNVRTRPGNREPSRAIAPSANAVSVDIATPQPPARPELALMAT